jgi:hypothetical protein
MDPVIASIVVFAILAVIAVASFIGFRRRSKVDITGPFGTKFTMDGSNDPPSTSGIKIGTAVAHKGDVITENQTGTGIEAEKLEAGRTVRTTLSQPENTPDPKA